MTYYTLMNNSMHDIVTLQVYPVFWFQDFCTPVWGKDRGFFCFFFLILLINANFATYYVTYYNV